MTVTSLLTLVISELGFLTVHSSSTCGSILFTGLPKVLGEDRERLIETRKKAVMV